MIKPIQVFQPRAHQSIEKSRYLSIVNLWPTNKIDVMGWLNNFSEKEKVFAYRLLENFMYFNDAICDELLRDAVLGLSRYIINFNKPNVTQLWNDFITNSIIVPVMGEIPSLTDSGLSFTRLARNVLGFEEEQIKTASDAISEMYWRHKSGSPNNGSVIFVDDFIGTGFQFKEAWDRPELDIRSIPVKSFRDLCQLTGGKHFFYCPLFATSYGLNNINNYCPEVIINPAHIINKEYSSLSPTSNIWGDLSIHSGVKFLYQVSLRTGMPDTKGRNPDDWRGFHKLGLNIAMRDSIPDASLCIFRWKDNWTPLFKN
jgi:hypothetical protein